MSPPVYVFTCGFGFTGGFEKADIAPLRAASRTLDCVSPGPGAGVFRGLVALVIESPSDRAGVCGGAREEVRGEHVVKEASETANPKR